MYGRYVRKSDKQKIAEHYAVHGPSVPDFGPSWNIAPQTFQPTSDWTAIPGNANLY